MRRGCFPPGQFQDLIFDYVYSINYILNRDNNYTIIFMNSNFPQSLVNIIFYSSLPGLGGGLVLFLYAYSKNHYKNNKYKIKLIIELICASVTATFITMLIVNPIYQSTTAFCVGLGWAKVIQIIRSKVTKLIELVLGED